MLSVVASDVLAVVDASALKHTPSTLPASHTPAEEHHTSAWASDNSALYLSSAQTISRFDPLTKQLKALHTLNDGYLIRCIATKDKCTVFYGAGASIHVLECGGQTPKVTQSFGPHKHDVLSLSLSNDSTLLACGLSNAAYVHNLTTGSQTTLRGLSSKFSIAMCVFHPHVRTRLLVGHWDQLFVYDTTRPSAPLKVIPMGDAGTCISAIACSPFSKTLVAVAMSNGGVGLVDLDKEKGLFRTLNLNVPLTTIAFSAEGASIYLGTENGKLLVHDLRALDKPPKSIIVSKSGNPINAISVQKKLKDASVAVQAKGTPKTVNKSMTSTPISKAAASPLRPRTTRPGGALAGSPARKASLATGTPKQTPSSKATGPKKVLSPARDPLGNSPRLDSREAPKVKKAHPLSNASVSSKPRTSSAKATLSSGVTGRTTSASNRTRRTSSTTVDTSLAPQQENTVTADMSSISNARMLSQTRKTSTTSIGHSTSASAAPRSTRTVSATSISSTMSRRKPSSSTASIPLVPSISTDFIASIRPVSSISKRDDDSRTPSPDLPDMKADLATPIPAQKKNMKAMAVLGLGTPEVGAWLKAGMGSQVSQTGTGGKGKGRVKSLGFRDGVVGDGELDCQVKETSDPVDLDGDWEEREREKSLSLQISPRPPLPASSSSQTHSHGPSHSWDASPMRTSSRHTAKFPSAGSAHELLRTIVRDVMYDFQKETRSEMMGLHLDLVRMGRGWKQELRTLMEEYGGDLDDLREENRRLRDENERLKRGF